MKLCHYRDHEYEEGKCIYCEKYEGEIAEIYALYYPTFDPGAALPQAHRLDDYCHF